MSKNIRKNRRKQLGILLQRERKCLRLDQEDVAQILGVTQEQISKIESGTRRLDVMELMEYCEALNLTPTALAEKIETYFFSMGLLPRPVLKKTVPLYKAVHLRVDVQICDNSYKATISDTSIGESTCTTKTFIDVKKVVVDSLRLHQDTECELEYNFLDAQSLLRAYSPYVSLAAISRVSGISQSLLSLYANGKKKPSARQLERIVGAINKIGKELMAVVS